MYRASTSTTPRVLDTEGRLLLPCVTGSRPCRVPGVVSCRGDGYWKLGIGSWVLDTGYWMLGTGYWVRRVGVLACLCCAEAQGSGFRAGCRRRRRRRRRGRGRGRRRKRKHARTKRGTGTAEQTKVKTRQDRTGQASRRRRRLLFHTRRAHNMTKCRHGMGGDFACPSPSPFASRHVVFSGGLVESLRQASCVLGW